MGMYESFRHCVVKTRKNKDAKTNVSSPGLTPIGPPMWQAEADTELTLSA